MDAWTAVARVHFGMLILIMVLFCKNFKATQLRNSSPSYYPYLLTLGIQSYCQRMIGVSNHLLSIVFRFHYHSQEVIGSLG